VLWNAFPWHPYRADDGDTSAGPCGPSSNRKPRLGEVAGGRHAFEALLRCFTRKLEIFAVGKVAEDALRRWGGADARAISAIRRRGESSCFARNSAPRSPLVYDFAMIEDLDTPALLLDRGKLERNCRRMRERVTAHGWRCGRT